MKIYKNKKGILLHIIASIFTFCAYFFTGDSLLKSVIFTVLFIVISLGLAIITNKYK